MTIEIIEQFRTELDESTIDEIHADVVQISNYFLENPPTTIINSELFAEIEHYITELHLKLRRLIKVTPEIKEILDRIQLVTGELHIESNLQQKDRIRNIQSLRDDLESLTIKLSYFLSLFFLAQFPLLNTSQTGIFY